MAWFNSGSRFPCLAYLSNFQHVPDQPLTISCKGQTYKFRSIELAFQALKYLYLARGLERPDIVREYTDDGPLGKLEGNDQKKLGSKTEMDRRRVALDLGAWGSISNELMKRLVYERAVVDPTYYKIARKLHKKRALLRHWPSRAKKFQVPTGEFVFVDPLTVGQHLESLLKDVKASKKSKKAAKARLVASASAAAPSFFPSPRLPTESGAATFVDLTGDSDDDGKATHPSTSKRPKTHGDGDALGPPLAGGKRRRSRSRSRRSQSRLFAQQQLFLKTHTPALTLKSKVNINFTFWNPASTKSDLLFGLLN